MISVAGRALSVYCDFDSRSILATELRAIGAPLLAAWSR
jgi:hypothetical protein